MQVLAAEALDPDRKKVRAAAAEWLFKLSETGNEKAAHAAVVHMDRFMELAGKGHLDKVAKLRIAQQVRFANIQIWMTSSMNRRPRWLQIVEWVDAPHDLMYWRHSIHEQTPNVF
jgi:hypothetical protein